MSEIKHGHGGCRSGGCRGHNGCDIHGSCKRRWWWRRILYCLLLLTFLILLVIFIVWLVLRPSKPRFYLQDASIIQLNVSSPHYGFGGGATISSILQVTISSRNPNDRIGIYYDHLIAYAAYNGQQITGATTLPVGFQGRNEVIVWSPFLFGYNIPISPFLAESIAQDKHAGILLLHVRVDGHLRWKVGSWISCSYHIHANCPAFLTVEKEKSHGGYGNYGTYYLRFQQMSTCTVDL